jgi:hypothetical protein
MNTIKDKLPFHLQRILDEVIGAFNNGDVAHDGVKEIEEWFELEGWDILISDLDDQMAINLCVLSSRCNDDELRASEYIADDAVLQDSDRIAWVRGLSNDLHRCEVMLTILKTCVRISLLKKGSHYASARHKTRSSHLNLGYA